MRAKNARSPHANRRASANSGRARPGVELLEDRMLLAAIAWNTDNDGFWDDATKWSPQQVPGGGDDVTIDRGAANPTITIRDVGQDYSVNMLTSRESLVVSARTLTVNAASQIDASTLTLSGGNLTANGAVTVTATGNISWQAGTIFGNGLANSGTVTISAAADVGLAGTLTNSAMINHTGAGNLVVTGTLINQANGVYDFQGDGGIAGTNTINNSGTIKKTAGAGESRIGPSVSSNLILNQTGGTIDAQSGRIKLDGLRGDSTVATWNASMGAVLEIVAHPSGSNSFRGTYSGTGAGQVELSGGFFDTADPGGATLDFPTGLFQWTGGSFGGSTSRPVTNAGTITLAGANDKGAANTLVNNGTLIHTGTGNLIVTGTLTNSATGVYDFQSDADMFSGSCCSTLTNLGTIRKTGGSDVSIIGEPTPNPSNVSLNFNNTGGTLDAQMGTLQLFNTRGDNTGGGTFNAATGAVLDLVPNNGASFAGTYAGSGGGTVQLSGGTFNVTSNTGPGATFDFPAGLFQWTGGSIANTHPNHPFTNMGTITLAGANDKGISGAAFNNDGTINHMGTGNLVVTGTFTNNATGVYDFQSDADLFSGNCCSVVANTGTIRKTGGSDVSIIGEPTPNPSNVSLSFNSTGGTLDAQMGTLQLFDTPGVSTGGTFNAAGGAVLELAPNGGASFAGMYTGSGMGKVQLTGGLSTSGAGATFDFPDGLFDWVSGSISGAGAGLTNNGTIGVTSASDKTLFGLLVNNDTIRHSGTGRVLLNTSSVLDVPAGGVYDFEADGGIGRSALGGGGTPEFRLRGTLRKSSGAGTSLFDGSPDTFNFNLTGGVVDVQSGRLKIDEGGLWQGGELNAAMNAVLELSSGAAMTGDFTGTGAGRVELSGGNFASSDFGLAAGAHASLNFPDGLLFWTGGGISSGGCGSSGGCATTMVNAGSITIEGPNGKGTGSTGLINEGTIVNLGPGDFGTGGSVFDNRAGATYEHRGDSAFSGLDQFGNSGRFINAGTIRKTAGVGTLEITAQLENAATGLIEVQSGRLKFSRGGNSTGGTFNMSAGAVLEFGCRTPAFCDTYNMAGTFTGTGPGTIEFFALLSGNPATLDFPPGVFHMLSGQLLGDITIEDTFDFAPAAALFTRANFTNNGTFIHSGAGDFLLRAAQIFVNNGVYDVRSDADFVTPADGGGIAIFRNNGTFRKSDGLGTTEFRFAPGGCCPARSLVVDNPGTFEVLTGTVSIQGPVQQVTGSTLNAGTWNVGAFSTLDMTAVANLTTNNASVTLDGPNSVFPRLNTLATNNGSFALAGGRDFTRAGNLTNSGQITVGPGSVLTVTGTFTDNANTLNIEVAGRPRTGQFGRVNVGGVATLNGALNINRVGGFGPTPNDMYQLMTFVSHVGRFSQINGLLPFFDAAVNATNVTLTVRSDAPTYDLDVDTIMVPLGGRPGENATINYTVQNLSANDLGGTWFDSLYLSRDITYSPDDLLIGRVEHLGGVAAMSTYNESLQAPLPAVIDGDYHVIVIADSRGLVPDTDRTNNTLASSSTVPIASQPLTFDVTTIGAIANGQDIYFRLDVPAGGDVLFTAIFAAMNQAEFFVRYREMPTRSEFDFVANDPTQLMRQINLTSPQAGPYYVLVHGREGAGAGQPFDITPQNIEFAMFDVSPARGSNRGFVTVTLTGAGFTPDTTVALKRSGVTTPAGQVVVRDNNTLYAVFDLRSLPVGSYSTLIQHDVQVVETPDAFTVTNGPLGRLATSISRPGAIRPGRLGTVTIEYANVGETNLGAPILILETATARMRLSEQTAFHDGLLPMLAINRDGPAGVLPPGYRGTIQVRVTPTGGFGGEYYLAIPGGSDVIDWNASKDAMRPPSVPLDAWDAIFANYVADVGPTYASYTTHLDNIATHLSRLGVYTSDVDRLQSYALQLADGFGTISTRYQLGALGRGHPDPSRIVATTEADGNVTISYGGIVRFFDRQPNGTFRGVGGDVADLALVSGALRLREPDGTLIGFTPAGQWSFTEDTAGRRISATYSGSQLMSLTDPSGDTVTYEFNANGRVSQVTDAVGRVTTYEYDASGQHLVRMIEPSGTTQFTFITGQGGAREHAISSIIYPNGSGVFYEYDARGRLIRETRDGGAAELTYSFDTTGTVTITDADGATTTTMSNELGQVGQRQDELGRVVRYGFDAVGNLTQAIGPGGLKSTFSYDARGNPTGATSPLGAQLGTAFNTEFADLLALRDGRGITTGFEYDTDGNRTAIAFTDGTRIEYTYDAQGRLVSTTNRRAQTTTFMYEPHGLVLREDYNDGSHTDFTYDSHRNLTSASGPTGVTSFEYDAADRLTKLTYPSGKFLTMTYNANGQRTAMTDQDGFTVNYTYDALGRLATVANGAAEVAAYTYDANGRLIRKDLGNDSFTTFAYDASGRVTSLVNRDSTGNVHSRFDYTFDDLGNVTQLDTLDGTSTYGYDLTGQLTSVLLPGGREIRYTYDEAGNRISVFDSGATTSYATNDLNEYTAAGTATFTYDADGNVTSRNDATGVTNYMYDDRGQLVSIVTPADAFNYEYDALGSLVATTRNGVRTDYLIDPFGIGNVVAQFPASGGAEHFIRGLGLSAHSSDTGSLSYYQFDPLGNTVGITDDMGAVTGSYSYLPFGEMLSASSAIDNPFTFGGLNGVLSSAGLHFMRARWYDPSLGRFTSLDPTGFASNDQNLYRFAENDPLSHADPKGLEPWNTLTAVSATLTALEGIADRGIVEGTISRGEANGAYNSALRKAADAAEAMTQSLDDLAENIEFAKRHFPAEQVDALVQRYESTIQKIQELADRGQRVGQQLNQFEDAAARAQAKLVQQEVAASEAGLSNQAASGGRFIRGAGKFIKRAGGPIGNAAQVALDPNIGEWLGWWDSAPTNGTPFGPQVQRRGDLPDAREFEYRRATERARVSIPCNITSSVAGIPVFAFFVGAVGGPVGLLVAFVGAGGVTYIVNAICWNILYVFPVDPNEIVGPAGSGDEHFVIETQTLPYTINFENKATATAPAQEVVVTQQLDSDLDWTTFAVGDFSFGSFTIQVPPGRNSYSTRVLVPATPETGGDDLFVDFTAGIDVDTGLATWTLRSIDPMTGDFPANPFAGFLPPNATAPNGEGSVNYRVRPKTGLTTGTRIDAAATIFFDSDPLATAPIFNTIDAGDPASGSVNPLAATTFSKTGTIPVSWTGTDDTGGSGIATFDVFVSDNGGPFTAFQTATAATTANFIGDFGHTYGFFSVATDAVGHVQPTPGTAQTMTTFMDPGPLVTDARINPTAARKNIANIVLTFDEALAPATANNPASFMLHTTGRDKRPGTVDDVMLGIATAVYDDALRTVTLTPQADKPLKLNQFLRVTAKGTGGVTNLGGASLDGDANNSPGGDFIRSLGLGTKLSFTDPTGDVVALALKRGGLIELSLPSTGDPTVRLMGTVAGTSTLTGTVKKPKTAPSDGRATIASITGTTGVNTAGVVRCSPAVTTNCLAIGSISAMVVDAILEREPDAAPFGI